MSRFANLLLLSALMLAAVGCSRNFYSIPAESYEQKVRVLGVAPIFVDADSDIRHPEKNTLTALLKDFNRKNEPELVAGLKDAGAYFSVALLPDDADKLFSSIFFRREKRDDAGIVYNKYFYKGPEIRELLAKNGLDALFLIVVSGLNSHESVFSPNLMAKLEADYNYLSISGQIIDAEGSVLWEFPNFRKLRLSYPLFLGLQYPDFDEARANETDRIDVKFKTIPGINRILEKSSSSSLRKKASVSDAYRSIFDEMISMLRRHSTPINPDDKPASDPQAGANTKPAPAPEVQPVAAPPASTPAAPVTPSVPAPQPAAPSITPPPGSPPAEPVASPAIAPAN